MHSHLDDQTWEKRKPECLGHDVCNLMLASNMKIANDSLYFISYKWQSISMFFVLSWNTGLAAICIAAWLSENNKVIFGWGIWRSWSKAFNQITSHTANAMALYFAFAENLDTVVCFFDLHDTKECPKNIQYPMVDLRVSGHPAQSKSEKALMCNSEVDE